jgi:hypothetical protein
MRLGFEACCDYVMVNTINPENATISPTTVLLTRENNTFTFEGPILIITFRSDGSVTGKGFTVRYTGKGTLGQHPYSYRIVHKNEPSGYFDYPNSNDVAEESDDAYLSQNEILILSFSSPAEPGDYTVGANFNATIDNIILNVNDDCESDQLNFFSSPSRDGFALVEHYPKENCIQLANGFCGNCSLSEHSINDTSVHSFGSMYRAFVAILKPSMTGSTDTHPSSFYLHWDTCTYFLQNTNVHILSR